MIISPLVVYTKVSPNKSARKAKIDTITIHHMACNPTIETQGDNFAVSSRQASSNYGIGSDGRIACYAPEEYRSWCSNSRANDDRAITIEVANDGREPDWHISDAAIASLIKLCADICQRNNIKELKWQDNKSLVGQIDKQNVTIHKWFANTACPGPYLHGKIGYVVEETNKILGGAQPSPVPSPEPIITTLPKAPFTIKVLTDDLKYFSEPTLPHVLKGTTGKGTFTIIETNGFFGKLKSGAGWADLSDASKYTILDAEPANPTPAPANTSYMVKVKVSALNMRKGPGTSYPIVGCIYDKGSYTITKEENGFGKLKSGAGWIALAYISKI